MMMENNSETNRDLNIATDVELKEKKQFALTIIGVVIVLVVVVLSILRTADTEPAPTVRTEKSNAAFNNLELEAKAIYVWDVLRGREIYSKNAEAQLHLASISKVMTAITALDHLSADAVVTIQNKDLMTEGDNGLLANERWTLEDLIDFSLVVSSNDGARAVASAVNSGLSDSGQLTFVDLMNQKSREIGLAQTYFIDPSGLDRGDLIAGGAGSARDVATMFEYALTKYPHILEATSYPVVKFSSVSALDHEAENTNELVSKLPGIIASKTGFTDVAGGNLAVVFEPEPGRPIILVALGSSLEGRFEDIEKLYLTTLDYIN